MNLITLLRSDTEEGQVLLTDVTEGLREIFKAHQMRYMEYFQRTAERKGNISMGSVRIVQSKHLAVTLMAVENCNLEATLEMRRDAARDMAGEGDALWVMTGVLVGVKELAYMMIARVSEGDYDRDHVSALCNDRDHVSAVICLGETFVVKS